MKRNAKFVAICLAAVFVLVLMCGVLVACNEDAKTPLDPDQNETPDLGGDDDGEDEDTPESGISSLVSDELIEHIIGYVATEGGKDGQEASMYMTTIVLKSQLEDMLDMPYKESYGETGMVINVEVDKTDEEDALATCGVYVLEGESQAKAFYDDLEAEEKEHAKQDGKYLIIESTEGLFKNTILKASAPSTFSKTRMDFIKDSVKVGGDYSYVTFVTRTNYTYDSRYEEADSAEYMAYYIYHDDTNCDYIYTYSKVEQDEIPTQEEITEMLKDYTSDSYVDTTKEVGYVFEKLIERTGLFYEDTTLYIDEAQVEGLEVDKYNYDKNTSKDLVIPAKVGEKNVIKAGLYFSNLASITLSEGILEMGDFGSNNELTTLSLPKSIKILYSYGCPFEYCSKLTTIKYAGTQAEWTALVEANNLDINERWCKYSAWDDAAQQSVQKTLSFTVQCSNGNISYPTAA